VSETCRHSDDDAIAHPECDGCSELMVRISERAEAAHLTNRAAAHARWAAASTPIEDVRRAIAVARMQVDTPLPPRSLLDRDSTPEDYEAERDAPSPGVWAGEPGADLRRLTQEETDALIRSELFRSAGAEEVTGVLSAIGGSVSSPPWNSGQPSVQRGGIDSDPLVRILARRAWGDRDRQWFALRGVRKGDSLTSRGGAPNVQRAWHGEYVIGTATCDARPGETYTNVSRAGDPVRCRVSDRLREPPHEALRRRFGFDQLTIERDVMRHAQVVTADRDGFRAEWMIAELALAQAVLPEGLIEMACQGLDRKLPRRGGEPDLNGDIIDEGEMHRAAFAFNEARQLIVDDPSQHVPWFGCSSTFRDEMPPAGLMYTPGARVAGTKPKPAVPRWARERRNRPVRGPGR